MEAELRARAPTQLYALAYEDMVRNDRHTIRLLLESLDLPTHNDVLDDMLERSSFYFRSGRQPGQENPRSFYRKGIVGEWRSQLEPQDKVLFKELAGDLLVRLGYESTSGW
jgi:Sulfotransferase domain